MDNMDNKIARMDNKKTHKNTENLFTCSLCDYSSSKKNDEKKK